MGSEVEEDLERDGMTKSNNLLEMIGVIRRKIVKNGRKWDYLLFNNGVI